MKYGNTTSEGCTQEEFDEILEFACTDKLPPFSQLFFIQLGLPLTEHGFQQKSSLFPTVHQVRHLLLTHSLLAVLLELPVRYLASLQQPINTIFTKCIQKTNKPTLICNGIARHGFTFPRSQ